MDSGRSLQIDPTKHPHLDYGYAMTSHSSQGQTADRVLIHVDAELGAKDLLNSRMAVSVSRGRYDAQIYTSSVSKLGHELVSRPGDFVSTNASARFGISPAKWFSRFRVGANVFP